ncbi:exosortase F system-associated protein [Flavobacteriaceae bacterium F08102]|nr:exosortase F system-associated protein [Flavobacteriaceae bacterium F08102]
MHKFIRIALIGILFVLLIVVRAYGAQLFYDPFIEYFHDDYLHKAMPAYSMFKLFLNIFLRYFLNTMISLGIIYLAFQKIGLVKFSIKFYAIAFVVLGFAYFVLLKIGMLNGHLFAFYVRRFLIHPVFVLILLPAFYYQKKLVRKSTS